MSKAHCLGFTIHTYSSTRSSNYQAKTQNKRGNGILKLIHQFYTRVQRVTPSSIKQCSHQLTFVRHWQKVHKPNEGPKKAFSGSWARRYMSWCPTQIVIILPRICSKIIIFTLNSSELMVSLHGPFRERERESLWKFDPWNKHSKATLRIG